MAWKFWCFFTIILNLFIIITEADDSSSLIIENIIPKTINPNVLRIDIKQPDGIVLYKLELKKTKGILANSGTPVIKYHDDFESKEKFYLDYEVMQGIGSFSFYHDIDNKASAVLFSDSDGLYLDGIIGDAFRLKHFPVNYLNNIINKPERYIESGSNVESLEENTWSKLNKAAQNVGGFYPELLIVLDHNLLANVSKIVAIKRQLVYWNAADMLFASMKSPEIYLNIAGFILPATKHAFPFLESEPGASFVDFYDAIEGVESLFYKYRDQLPIDYNILVAMTGSSLCVTPTRANPVMNCINGFSEGKPDISNKFDDEREAVDTSALLHFDNQVSSYTNAAQKIGFMFTGEYTQKKEMKKCPGIMEEYYRRGRFSLSWSSCTQRKVAGYLESPKAEGLQNFPKYLLEEKRYQMLPTEPTKTLEIPEINESNGDLERKGFSNNFNTSPSVSLSSIGFGDEGINAPEPGNSYFDPRIEDLESTTMKLSIEKRLGNPDDYTFVDVTASSEDVSVDDHTDVSENNLEESTVSLELSQQNLSDVSVVEEQITREERLYPLDSKAPIVDDDDDKVLEFERRRAQISDEDLLAHEREGVKLPDEDRLDHEIQVDEVPDEDLLDHEMQADRVSDEDLVAHERRGVKVSDDVLLAHERQGDKVSDEDLLAQEREGQKVSDEDLLTHERRGVKVSDDVLLAHEQNDQEILSNNQKKEAEATDEFPLNTYEAFTEEYSNQNDSLLDLNTSNSNESATELIIDRYSDQDDAILDVNSSTSPLISLLSRTSEVTSNSTELVQDDSTTEKVGLISVTESSASSTESTSCKREKMKLDVTLQLNINTNDKNIKTFKKTFHDGSLNQENPNTTDTNDNDKAIRNIIDYLLKHSDK